MVKIQEIDVRIQAITALCGTSDLRDFTGTEQSRALVAEIVRCWPGDVTEGVMREAGYSVFRSTATDIGGSLALPDAIAGCGITTALDTVDSTGTTTVIVGEPVALVAVPEREPDLPGDDSLSSTYSGGGEGNTCRGTSLSSHEKEAAIAVPNDTPEMQQPSLEMVSEGQGSANIQLYEGLQVHPVALEVKNVEDALGAPTTRTSGEKQDKGGGDTAAADYQDTIVLSDGDDEDNGNEQREQVAHHQISESALPLVSGHARKPAGAVPLQHCGVPGPTATHSDTAGQNQALDGNDNDERDRPTVQHQLPTATPVQRQSVASLSQVRDMHTASKAPQPLRRDDDSEDSDVKDSDVEDSDVEDSYWEFGTKDEPVMLYRTANTTLAQPERQGGDPSRARGSRTVRGGRQLGDRYDDSEDERMEDDDWGIDTEDSDEGEDNIGDGQIALRRLSNFPISTASRRASMIDLASGHGQRRVTQATMASRGTGAGNQAAKRVQRSNSLEELIIVNDDLAMAPQLMSDNSRACRDVPARASPSVDYRILKNWSPMHADHGSGAAGPDGTISGEAPTPLAREPQPAAPSAPLCTPPVWPTGALPASSLGKRTPGPTTDIPQSKRIAISTFPVLPTLSCEVLNYAAVREQAFHGKIGTTVETLFKFYTNPVTMAKALILLETLCGPESDGGELGPVTAPEARAIFSGPRVERLDRMVAAAVKANKICQRSRTLSGNADFTIREIMAFITLHLIYKNVVTPNWRRGCQPLLPDGTRQGKSEYFYKMMGGEEALKATQGTFMDRVIYGHIMWKIAESLGVPTLLMVAAGGRSVSAVARKHRIKTGVTEALALALSTSPLWWSFSRVVGVLTVDRLFSPPWMPCKAAQLAYRMRVEALPVACIQEWDEACRGEGIVQASSSLLDDLPLARGVNYPLMRFRWFNYPLFISPIMRDVDLTLHTQHKDVGVWLRGLGGQTWTIAGEWQGISAWVLKNLLPDGVISDELMDFYAALYNRRALDGRMVLNSTKARVLLQQPGNGTGLSTLAGVTGAALWQMQCRETVVPLNLGNAILALRIFLGSKSAVIYNWTAGDLRGGLDKRGLEVVKQCLPATGWTITLASQEDTSGVQVKTLRESSLCFLHYSRAFVCGTISRFHVPDLRRQTTITEITRGLLIDIFSLSQPDGWVVHPRYWSGLTAVAGSA